jgi:YgiT-type zinc finger domain-containing protein
MEIRFENEKGGSLMKCMKCGRETFKSTTSEAIELEFGLLVIRNIPCWKCEECDEVFYTGDVVQKIEEIIERAKIMMQEISIVDYNKAA